MLERLERLESSKPISGNMTTGLEAEATFSEFLQKPALKTASWATGIDPPVHARDRLPRVFPGVAPDA
jgi:hypothetical protein